MTESYKLTYFNVRALGEPIRLLLAYAEIPYEDHRIGMEEWAPLKASYPWGKLPALQVGNQTLSQSKAILRYLANRNNLGGEDYWEAAKMDEIADSLSDLQAGWSAFFFEKDEGRKTKMAKEYFEVTVPKYLSEFEAILKNNGGMYLVGKKRSWVEFQMVNILESLENQQSNIFDKFPGLGQLKQSVFSIPQIKAWIDKRPNTPF